MSFFQVLCIFCSLFTTAICHAELEPSLQFENKISAFKKSANQADAFAAMIDLQGFRIVNTGKVNEQKLTAEDADALRRADRLQDSVKKMTQDFESKLTLKDIAAIAKNNPDSIFIRLKRFYLSNANCTQDSYLKLKKEIPVKELYDRGQWVGPYLMALEANYFKSYRANARKLIESDMRFEAERPLLDTVLNKRFDESASDREPNQKFEKQLVKTGIAPEAVHDYAIKMATISPECMGAVSGTFMKYLRNDFDKIKK